MSAPRLLQSAIAGDPITREQAAELLEDFARGSLEPELLAAALTALRIRGESLAVVLGFAEVARRHGIPVDIRGIQALDLCGTGGDGQGTVNLSTAAAFVVAGAGVPVAKHGNRAFTSKSGAADVLAALGIGLELPIETLEKALVEARVCFLMAPRHHSAMRNVAGPRVELAPTRTIFNLLGPLANPAGTRLQVMGVFTDRWAQPLAEVLGRLGAERAWVVHGSDGLDELTTTGPSLVAEWRDGKVTTFEVTPEAAGLPRARPEDLKGGDAAVNATALTALLGGAPGAYRDIVLLNAAAALVVAGKAADLKAGVRAAADAVDSRRAQAVLQTMVAITNRESV